MIIHISSSCDFAFFSSALAYNILNDILKSSLVHFLEMQQAPRCLLPASNPSSGLDIASLSYTLYALGLIKLRILLNLRFPLLAAQRLFLVADSIALIARYKKRYKF